MTSPVREREVHSQTPSRREGWRGALGADGGWGEVCPGRGLTDLGQLQGVAFGGFTLEVVDTAWTGGKRGVFGWRSRVSDEKGHLSGQPVFQDGDETRGPQ